MRKQANEDMKALLRRTADGDISVATAAQYEMAAAIAEVLRQGVMPGDALDGIFTVVDLTDGQPPEFPLHFLHPGTEKDYVAYAIPQHGYIPEKHIEGDLVMIPTYMVGGSIDWNLKFAKNARWDVVGQAKDNLNMQFVKKFNDDGWHVILGAAVDRNILVYDGDAGAGAFTKRLVSAAKTIMRRNSGGNSTSTNRGRLTDLYISPEADQDIVNWGVDQVDEITRREIHTSADGLSNLFKVNLHVMDELGEGQEYQLYATNVLGASVASGDAEFAVGLDLSSDDSFIMPVAEDVQIFPDPALHRRLMEGYYGYAEVGFASLDNRRVLLLSL